MDNKIKKIEILSEQDFNNLIDKHDFEKFSCSCNGQAETDNIVCIAIYSDYDMFDELAEQLSNSDYGFRLYGGTKCTKTKFVLLEIF